MNVTVIATGFEGMNGEKSKPALDLDLDEDFLSSSPAADPSPVVSSRSSSSMRSGSSVRSSQSIRGTEPRVDPAVIDDDDTFTDIMSIFNRK